MLGMWRRQSTLLRNQLPGWPGVPWRKLRELRRARRAVLLRRGWIATLRFRFDLHLHIVDDGWVVREMRWPRGALLRGKFVR